MTIKTMCFDLVLNGLNRGIVMCMAGAVLLLLYPLLKKLAPPQVRCYLWSLFFAALLAGSNGRTLFPVGFEDLVSTRSSRIVAGFPPAFLPGEYRGEGATTRLCRAGRWSGLSSATGSSGPCFSCGWRGSSLFCTSFTGEKERSGH